MLGWITHPMSLNQKMKSIALHGDFSSIHPVYSHVKYIEKMSHIRSLMPPIHSKYLTSHIRMVSYRTCNSNSIQKKLDQFPLDIVQMITLNSWFRRVLLISTHIESIFYSIPFWCVLFDIDGQRMVYPKWLNNFSTAYLAFSIHRKVSHTFTPK